MDASEVLKKFQHMAGLNESGVLDSETMKVMNMPRCGNKDMEVEMIPDEEDGEENSIRRKRYKLSQTGSRWRKRELTYTISRFSNRMTVAPDKVERDVAQAFRLWESVTNLNFIRSKDRNVRTYKGQFLSLMGHKSKTFFFDGLVFKRQYCCSTFYL